MSPPLVSCLCATYSRPRLLEEAIKCFVDQDYSNKELIVLNDQVGVELFIENCPDNIQIYNHSIRFSSLGEKRNYLKSLGKGDYFCIWDDDDLYRCHRLSKSVQLMQENGDRYDIIKPQYALMSTNNKNYQIVQNLFHSQSCITKDYMEKHHYPLISVGEDAAFESKARIKSFPVEPWYVYRWGRGSSETDIHHLSGIADEKKSWERSLTFYSNMSGKIRLEPKFYADYWVEIDAFLKDKKLKDSA